MVGIRPLSVVRRGPAAGYTPSAKAPEKRGPSITLNRLEVKRQGSQVEDHDDRVLTLVHVVVRPDSHWPEPEGPVELQGRSVAPPHLQGGQGAALLPADVQRRLEDRPGHTAPPVLGRRGD